jgi:hypothetical protein
VLRRIWPGDRGADIIVRAASSPATTAAAGWANTLAATAVADLLLNLGPASAGSALLRHGLQLEFTRSAAIWVPGVLMPASSSKAIRFVCGCFHSMARPLRPASSQPSRHSATRPSSTACRQSRRSCALCWPSQLVKRLTARCSRATRATRRDRPAGLLMNITPIAASANTIASDAMSEDVADLVGAVSGVAGNSAVVFVASPRQAAALRLRYGRDASYEILASSALGAGTVIGIASNSVASAIDPAPNFHVADQAVLASSRRAAFG